MVTCHLLIDGDEAVVIDTGLIGEIVALEDVLRSRGMDWSNLKAILLTHGHLDHAGTAWRIQLNADVPVYAHPLEQRHIDGTYPYHGIARFCGWLEGVGRQTFDYQPVTIDHPFADGEELPFWGGLRVVHLPGHSDGHCGFYSARHDLLFVGDLFARWGPRAHCPPPWFNSGPQHFPSSFRRAREIDPAYMVPNHYSEPDYLDHRRAFDRLCERVLTG